MSEHHPNSALIEAITYRLWRLDSTQLAAVALTSGFDIETLRDLGGLD